MKTILVLTDLSTKAENAAVYAFKIATKTSANLILFHSCESFQPVNVPESSPWEYEDYEAAKNESLTALTQLKMHLLTNLDPGTFKPEINLLNDIGLDLGSSVNQLVKNKNVDLIIMGTKGDDTLSHIFNGSDASDILEHANCPVLFVPEVYDFDQLKTIVFANDFKKNYNKEVSFLVKLAKVDQSHIILVHFGEYDNNAYTCLNYIKDTLGYADVTSRVVAIDDTHNQLRKFEAHVKADLTVMIHHHGFQLDRLFSGSRSKSMLDHSEVPLLILPG
jgi:nucleotide-binding universal stress UspA family protein